MPSGFQQDVNQLQPKFYKIVIDTTGYPATDTNTGGGVSPTSSDAFTTANLPTTLAKGKNRARANMRFRNIINRLSGIADCQILDIVITEANGDAQATSLQFTVKYDRADGILDAVKAQLGSPYLGADGATTIDTTIKALTDQVVRGIRDTSTANVRVYDGTAAQDSQLSITVTAPDTGLNVWADVTVTLVAEASLFGV